MKGVVLVTGASGGVGVHACAALSAVGWRVRALVHRTPVSADETVDADVLEPKTLVAAVAGTDAIVHLAGVTHARRARTYEANVRGTDNLLAAAAAAGVNRFVYVSTRAVGVAGGAYSRSKREAESLVARSRLDTTIVRLPEILGVGGDEGVDRIVHQLDRGRPIPVVGRGLDQVCPIRVEDAAAAIAAAASSPAAVGKVYTLAGPCMTVAEFVRRSAELRETKPRIVRVPVAVVRVLSELARAVPLPLYPDQLSRLRAPKPPPSTDARSDLGFDPRPIFD